MRARVEFSNGIRKIEFTEAVKRRLIDEMKNAVDSVQNVQREIGAVGRQLNPKNKKQKLEEEGRKHARAPGQGAEDHAQIDDRRARTGAR